ncbi:MAG: hypothetical protein H6568_11580 [Lewinellaceae bacterium]|nr:hypothetical protein [Saprospiraceae bacterium]MCB9313393.1 hypothetical protein [Lewinellaceae bacterium]HRW74744.1 hypothetical protein [Saprospiraceae bacterium]
MAWFPASCSAQSLNWSPDRLLSWDDFQGIPQPAGEEAAHIDCGIICSLEKVNIWTGRPRYAVSSYMNPQSSWVDPEQMSDPLLAHEQLHFDMAEWYAVKIRRALSARGVTVKRGEEILTRLLQEFDHAQTQYDLDTNHGRLSTVQSRWTEQVQNGLAPFHHPGK